jgi:hypothetical protein
MTSNTASLIVYSINGFHSTLSDLYKKCMLFNYIYSVFLLCNVEKDVINICNSIFSYDAINVE